jgi:Tol biopolymer transport system component
MSADGRVVAFTSGASDLVTHDNNGNYDVFVRDLQTGITTLVSRNYAGTGSGNGYSGSPKLSADGRFLAFSSGAGDLVLNDGNATIDLFVRDLQTGITALVSRNYTGTGSGNSHSYASGAISADGHVVAFHSDASDLVANDNNGALDLFVRNLQTGTTTLVSVNQTGTGSGNIGASTKVALSADGRLVAFQSYSSDLVANDNNEAIDVFIRDLQTGTTRLISVNQSGTGSGIGGGEWSRLSFSADGRFLAFSSGAGDLVANDTNFTEDVFVRDLQTGKTTLMSVNLLGKDSGDYNSNEAVLSADGRFVLFSSRATDLVPTDSALPNNNPNVFVRPVQ